MSRNVLTRCSLLYLSFTLFALNICSIADGLQSESQGEPSTDDNETIKNLKATIDQLMEMVKQQGEMLNAMRNENKNNESAGSTKSTEGESQGSTKATKSESERGTLGKAVEAASWAYFGYQTAKELCEIEFFDENVIVSRIKKFACPSKKSSWMKKIL